jgi:hypothetical protein
MPVEQYEQFVESIPSVVELRDRLAKNSHERDLIKRLLKLSEQKDKLKKGAAV